MRLGTTFSGIGAPEQALRNLKWPHVISWACDNDNYAKLTYDANHRCQQWHNDVAYINLSNLKEVDIYVFGFPCQDISVAGSQDLSVGRSTLVEHSLRLIERLRPKMIVFENVKNITSKKFRPFLDSIFKRLLGLYHLKWDVLNSADFGVPHHRERFYCVGLLKETGQTPELPTNRRIISASDCYPCDDCGDPVCPRCVVHYAECACLGPDSENALSEILEPTVDPKYFLSQTCIERIRNIKYRAEKRGYGYTDTVLTPWQKMINLDANYFKGADGKRGMIYVGTGPTT